MRAQHKSGPPPALTTPRAALDPNPAHRTETVVKRVTSTPATASAKGAYARATMRTSAALADPKASLMDRYRAAEAEEAACRAAREAEAELEAGA